MEDYTQIQDLFENEYLSNLYKQAATTNRKLVTRPVLDLDEPEEFIRQVNTQELEGLFHQRFGLFYDMLRDGKLDLLDFYRERALLDILELFRTGSMPGATLDMDPRYKDFIQMLKNDYVRGDKDYLQKMDSIEGPVESEEEMDKFLRAMLGYRAYRHGRGNIRHYNFILKQCFFENSAIMKNKEKYEEIVYRALEGFAKEEQIQALDKLEKRIRERLIEAAKAKKRDESFDKTIAEIIRDLKELVRTGWSINDRTTESVAQFLERAPLRNPERKRLMQMFSKVESKGQYDNSPIVIINKLKQNERGLTTNTLVQIDEEHARQMVWGGPYAKLSVLNTIYHENVHVRQNRELGNPTTLERYLQLKTDILIERDTDDDLYEKIYESSEISELEAHQSAAIKTAQFVLKNGLDIDITPILGTSENYAKRMQEFLNQSLPLKNEFGIPVKKKKLSDALEDIISENVYECSREKMEQDFGEEADELMGEFLLKSSVSKYKKDKTKPFAIEDYLKGNNILRDYPILRIEYGNDGKRRSMGEFLRNARELLTNFKFLNSDRKVSFVVDKDIKHLIEDIFEVEFMKPENLAEVLYQLSKDDLAPEWETKKSMYTGFIREITSDKLGFLFLDATKEIPNMSKEALVNSVQMCKVIQGFIDDPTKEERNKRREFFSGLFEVEPGSGESPYTLLMKNFVREATKFLEKEDKKKEGQSLDD